MTLVGDAGSAVLRGIGSRRSSMWLLGDLAAEADEADPPAAGVSVESTEPVETTEPVATTEPVETTEAVDTTLPVETTQPVETSGAATSTRTVAPTTTIVQSTPLAGATMAAVLAPSAPRNYRDWCR
jgi:hypothetical protein